VNDVYSPSERCELGRQCKFLLDYGRCMALQSRLSALDNTTTWTAKVVRFVPNTVTLENNLIFAYANENYLSSV
jgi:hypothetical protein